MRLQLAPVLILAVAAALIGYGLWWQARHPPRVVSTGVLAVPAAGAAHRIILDTRVIDSGGIRHEEVRLPGGSWIDCGGDCRQAVRRSSTHVFEEQQSRGR